MVCMALVERQHCYSKQSRKTVEPVKKRIFLSLTDSKNGITSAPSTQRKLTVKECGND
jgi:hypothetical protein